MIQAVTLYVCCLAQIESSGDLSGIMQAVKLCWRCTASWWIETEWQSLWQEGADHKLTGQYVVKVR